MSKKKSIKPKATKPDKAEPLDVGRPSKYKPEYCQGLIQHMSEGLSFESYAAVIDVNRDTLYEWEKTYPEFSDAKKQAVDKCQLTWEKIGIEHILNISSSESSAGIGGSSNSKSLNASAWIFNMKNRFKWRDKQPDESEVVINNFNNLSDAELDAKLKKLSGEK